MGPIRLVGKEVKLGLYQLAALRLKTQSQTGDFSRCVDWPVIRCNPGLKDRTSLEPGEKGAGHNQNRRTGNITHIFNNSRGFC